MSRRISIADVVLKATEGVEPEVGNLPWVECKRIVEASLELARRKMLRRAALLRSQKVAS